MFRLLWPQKFLPTARPLYMNSNVSRCSSEKVVSTGWAALIYHPSIRIDVSGRCIVFIHTTPAAAFPVAEQRSKHYGFRCFQVTIIRNVFLIIILCIAKGSSSVFWSSTRQKFTWTCWCSFSGSLR